MDPIGTAEKLPAVARGLGGMLGDPVEVIGLLLIVIALLVVAIWYVFKQLLAAHGQLVEKLDKVEKLAEMVTRSATTQGSASDRIASVSDRVAEAILVLAANQGASRRRRHEHEDVPGGEPYPSLPQEGAEPEVRKRRPQARRREEGDPDR